MSSRRRTKKERLSAVTTARFDGKDLFGDKSLHAMIHSDLLDVASLCALMGTCTTLRWHTDLAFASACGTRVLAGAASISNPAAAAARVAFLERAGAKFEAFQGAALVAACEAANVDLVRHFLTHPAADAITRIACSKRFYDRERSPLGTLIERVTGCDNTYTRSEMLERYKPVVDALIEHPRTHAWLRTLDASKSVEGVHMGEVIYKPVLKTFQDAASAGFTSIVRAVVDRSNPLLDSLSAAECKRLLQYALSDACDADCRGWGTNFHMDIVDLLLQDARCDPTYNDNIILKLVRQSHDRRVVFSGFPSVPTVLHEIQEWRERVKPEILERLLQDPRIAALDVQHAQTLKEGALRAYEAAKNHLQYATDREATASDALAAGRSFKLKLC